MGQWNTVETFHYTQMERLLNFRDYKNELSVLDLLFEKVSRQNEKGPHYSFP